MNISILAEDSATWDIRDKQHSSLFQSGFSLLARCVNRVDDLIDDGRIRELSRQRVSRFLHGQYRNGGNTHRRGITEAVLLARENLPQDSSHDLARTCLGQIGHHEDRLGRRKRSDGLAHLRDQLLPDLLIGLVAILERDEGVDRLSRELVGDAHHRGFGHRLVFDQRRFDLRRGQPMAADVDDVVDAPADPVVSFVIASGSIARELFSSVGEPPIWMRDREREE